MSDGEWFHIGRNGDELAAYVYGDIPSPPEAESFFAELNSGPTPKTLDLYINSWGGDLFTAMGIHDRLKRFADNGCSIRVFVEGIAASGAALICAAADEVFVREDASVMLHEPRYVDGRAADDRVAAMCAGMARRLAAKTRRGADAVLDVLREGRWLNAEEATSLGLADAVTGDEGLRA